MKIKTLIGSIVAAGVLAGCGAKNEEVAVANNQAPKVAQEQASQPVQQEQMAPAQEMPKPLSNEEAYGTQTKYEEQTMAKAGICEPRFDERAPGGIASIKCGAAVSYDFDDEYDDAVREAEILSKRKIAEAMKNRIVSNSLIEEKSKKGIENMLVGDEQQRRVKMQKMKEMAERIESNVDSVLVGVIPLAQGDYARGNKKYVYVISGVNFSTLEFFNELGKRTEDGLRERGYNPYTGEGPQGSAGMGGNANAQENDEFRGNYKEQQRDLPQAPTEMKSRAYYDF